MKTLTEMFDMWGGELTHKIYKDCAVNGYGVVEKHTYRWEIFGDTCTRCGKTKLPMTEYNLECLFGRHSWKRVNEVLGVGVAFDEEEAKKQVERSVYQLGVVP